MFDFAAQRISIEGDAPRILDVLQEARNLAPLLTEIRINTARPESPQSHETPPQTESDNSLSNGQKASGTTIKQFIRKLRLLNSAERIAAIAYYVKQYESRDTFSPKEMSGWFTIAGQTKPSQMSVAVFDAKKKYGYLDSTGHGKWKLTPNGENLVVSKLNEMETD
ncbi:MAG: hypothetical protein WD851_01060 [Pirellulales bacterium]